LITTPSTAAGPRFEAKPAQHEDVILLPRGAFSEHGHHLSERVQLPRILRLHQNRLAGHGRSRACALKTDTVPV
jgi:hypothetical protein